MAPLGPVNVSVSVLLRAFPQLTDALYKAQWQTVSQGKTHVAVQLCSRSPCLQPDFPAVQERLPESQQAAGYPVSVFISA